MAEKQRFLAPWTRSPSKADPSGILQMNSEWRVAETPPNGAGDRAENLKQEIRRLLLDYMRVNRLGQARFAGKLGVRTGKINAWVNARRLPSKTDMQKLDGLFGKNGELAKALRAARPKRVQKPVGANTDETRLFVLTECI